MGRVGARRQAPSFGGEGLAQVWGELVLREPPKRMEEEVDPRVLEKMAE